MEDVPQPMPQETIKDVRPPPPPLRPKMSSGAESESGGDVLKCSCFRLPNRSKKQKPAAPPPLVTTKLIGSAGRRSNAVESSAAPQSPSVTFLASVSLSTWWPSSPSSAGPAPAPHNIGNVVAPSRRASTSAPRNGLPRASSSSFSRWRRSLSSSSRRIMPHGGAAAAAARASFSFPTSPASASSSCMSTPKIPQGCQQ